MNTPLRGFTALLLHAFPLDARMWDETRTELGEVAVVAPTLPPQGGGRTLAGWAAAVLRLVEGEIVPVGVSMGGYLAFELWRQAPERISGLFFFDFVYPGIGPRMVEPERLNNIWYQSFHQMEMAPALVGASRESCRLYIGHFLRGWSHRKHVFDDQLEAFTDNFLKAGNLAGGFAHYRAAHAGRVRMMKGEAPALPPIGVPTCVRWAEHDPLFPYQWTDRLGETFTNLDLAMFPDVGHFPHREDPDRAASEIAAFFTRIGWR